MPEKRVVAPVLLPKAWTTSTDATVFAPTGTTAAQRKVIQARLEAIDGVAKVTWESPEEAYRRLPEKLRRDGRDPAKVTLTDGLWSVAIGLLRPARRRGRAKHLVRSAVLVGEVLP